MKDDQREVQDASILDCRAEYGSLMTAYSSVSSMYWTGYTAFFAVNTLLATALGLSYSGQAATMAANFIKYTRIMIPMVGMAISLIAIHAARLINDHQKIIIDRGKELDGVLATRSFTRLAPMRNSFPWATTFGSLMFLAIWGIALYSAL
jgi:hypothetical protein